MGLEVLSESTGTVISLSEALTHCRVESGTDDDYISALISAATTYVENVTGRQLLEKQYRYWLDEFPSGNIILPKAPLITVDGIEYATAQGVYSAFAAYEYDEISEPGRVFPTYGNVWPTPIAIPNAVCVTFTCGYAAIDSSGTAGVPEAIKQAVKILVSHWYEERAPIVTGTIVAEIPMSVTALLWQYRTFGTWV